MKPVRDVLSQTVKLSFRCQETIFETKIEIKNVNVFSLLSKQMCSVYKVSPTLGGIAYLAGKQIYLQDSTK